MDQTFFRLGLKLGGQRSEQLPLTAFIPVFHRWIRDQVVDGPLLDVADYSHVHNGPGVLLAAHDANYCVDTGHGRFGLMWYNKRATGETPADLLRRGMRRVLEIAERLQREPELQGAVRFDAASVLVFSNDRLAAPNSEAAAQALEATVRTLAGDLFGAGGFRIEREADPRERLALCVVADEAPGVEVLRSRI